MTFTNYMMPSPRFTPLTYADHMAYDNTTPEVQAEMDWLLEVEQQDHQERCYNLIRNALNPAAMNTERPAFLFCTDLDTDIPF